MNASMKYRADRNSASRQKFTGEWSAYRCPMPYEADIRAIGA
ncbi:hypothetical protein L810_2217 [Burkholderia sp. AU4i]|nr:hypothetical protein L810_2217 [Burkholderia sp. AU4i]